MHCVRLGLVASVFWMIHLQHQKLLQRESLRATWAASIDELRDVFPTADHWSEPDSRTGSRFVLDTDGSRLGFAVQTAPQSNSIIGFSGPSNLLLIFSTEGTVLECRILSSGDTRDHVEKIRRDPAFQVTFTGRSWPELARDQQFDAVSGATLTSLAMRRGIAARLGGSIPNLLFPEQPPVEWVQQVYPQATQLLPVAGPVEEFQVLDSAGLQLGMVLRTTPVADDIVGYQGPTESLLCLVPSQAGDVNATAEMHIKRLIVGRSYDNAEYVGYVRDDWSFPEVFNEMTLRQLADADLKQLGIEGVSGATMTSLAVGEGAIRVARKRLEASAAPPESAVFQFSWTWHEASALLVIVLAAGFGLSPWRGSRWGRRLVLIIVVLVLGIINGTLISQAMLVGWARSGVPVMSALALVSVTLVAFSSPTLTRQNVYCSHLCPHGAVQQLVMPGRKQQWVLGRRWYSLLTKIPFLLLIACLLIAVIPLPLSLVDLEPFDAWVPTVAGWPAMVLAILGLLISIRIPMAYCRFGCPTGHLLQYLRRHGQSHLATFTDLIIVAILACSAVIVFQF